jgi:hypothetical protein
MSTLAVNNNSKSRHPTPAPTSPSSPLPANAAQGAAGDPSMEDIFADIRRTLAQEEGPREPAQPWPETSETAPYGAPPSKNNNVVVLDHSMTVTAPTSGSSETMSPPPEPSPLPSRLTGDLVAPEAAEAAANSVSNLVRSLAADRAMRVGTGGPTVEDIVRDTVRSLIKDWLDTNLPQLVERLVRVEIERVVGRAI